MSELQPALAHSIAQILRKHLTTGSGALFVMPAQPQVQQWPLYVSTLPDTPDDGACLYDTDGIKDTRLLASGAELVKFGIQLRLRARSYQTGWTTTQAAGVLLSKIKRTSITLDSSTYVVDSIIQTSPILSLGQDQKRRDEFSLNLLAMVSGF